MKLIAKSKFRDYTKPLENEKPVKLPDNVIYHPDAELLTRARQAWDNLRLFRMQRRRNIRYTFGDQWGDLVVTEKGTMTERQRLSSMDGQPPLQNNHMSKIERALTGIYSKSSQMPVCFARQENSEAKSEMMTNALQTNWERNSERELLSAEMSEMIVGGLPVMIEEWSTENGVDDAYSYVVNPDYFFYESKANDPRMWDVSLVGEIRDYTFNELCAAFAQTEEDIRVLRAIYKDRIMGTDGTDQFLHNEHESFSEPPVRGYCRTYHVWTQEQKPRLRCIDLMDDDPLYTVELSDQKEIDETNEARTKTFTQLFISQGMDPKEARKRAADETPLITYERFTDLFWKMAVLTPQGIILKEEESPYEHKSHPYVFRPHQLVAGKICPFISVVIDQQRYVNRLITLKDMYLRSMTKGLKLIPKSVLGDLTPKEFARQAVELNGWVFYEPDNSNPNATPQVVSQAASDLGIEDMIQLQVAWMNDISSISASLQGKSPGTGVAASRYMMETENSTTAIASILQKFSCFERDLAMKKMKVIHQFYQQPRPVSNSGVSGYKEYSMYDPAAVEDIDFDISIKESAESPVSRMMINDVIQQMWQTGAINALQMLELSYLPGGQNVIQKLRAAVEQQQQQAATMQQQAGQAQSAQLPQINQQEAAPNGNKVTVNMVRNLLEQQGPQQDFQKVV